MNALNIEDVKLAGKPATKVVRNLQRTVRYPTQAATLQDAINMCSPGDAVAIAPGVYTETFEIDRDLTFFRDSDVGAVVLVSRHVTTVQVNRCKVSMSDMTIVVEEGALAHHPLQCDHAEVELESVECYGGLYSFFAFDKSKISANRCLFHNSYSHGVLLLQSEGRFENCFFFKNLECGVNISGGASDVTFFRCRSSDNGAYGMHIHTGGTVHLDACDVMRNKYSGVAITGQDERLKIPGAKHGKFSSGFIENSRVTSNGWQAVLLLDGSLDLRTTDLRRNRRGALTLSCSKKAINQVLDDNNQKLDPEYYSAFQETGEVTLKGNTGVLDDGVNQFCFASELPEGWGSYEKDDIIDLFKRCWMPLQTRLHGYPQGYTSDLLRDPQGRVKVYSLFKQWMSEEIVNTDENEMEMEIHDFLRPIGLEDFAEKFHGCECTHVHDIISFTDGDLLNIGMKKLYDRRMVLSRLAAVSGVQMKPKYMKKVDFGALVEATQFQAKGEELKKRFVEWKKLQPQISEYIGSIMSGPKYDLQVRKLFGELDMDDNAVLDLGELLLGLQKSLGVNTMQIDIEALFKEADLDESGDIDYQEFNTMLQVVLRT
uniref:Probable pectate lyase C n=2 Tax=Hemiselmis andersenii TaxID=464988 RepID=A0A6U4LUB1_HEMAN|mmetsp:Transcript_427/g.937  ORF Transcript_427/g.937 Transcript_427/m.937 type:complete len:599 (+) Transcript_427:195-1991(+)